MRMPIVVECVFAEDNNKVYLASWIRMTKEMIIAFKKLFS